MFTRIFPLALLVALTLAASTSTHAQNWPQGPGSNFDFTAPAASTAPTEWSVSLDRNIAWRTTLPETGQSAPVVWGERVFVTTMKPVETDGAESGSDIVAYCLSAEDGAILWQRDIPGNYATRLSAPFGDASSPAAVTDGTHVWFLNPTGRVVCFDLEGKEQWSKAVTSVSRTRPVLFEGKLIFHRQVYLPDANGKFGHENKEAGLEKWTQLQALDAATGDLVWTSTCGVNMGCVPLVQKLEDGTAVLVVGRGGGHGPPETPDGVSMIRADTGETLWTRELNNFMSTQTYPVVDGWVLVFHKEDHLWIEAKTGKIRHLVSFVDNVPVRRWTGNGRETVIETLGSKKPRFITQQSNLRVGDYHYFRAYTRNYLGRIHLPTRKVEYLELPLQVLREPGKLEQALWNAEHRDPADLAPVQKKPGLPTTSLRHNAVKNSRGLTVMGDDRARQNGWGHTASPLPTAFGDKLCVPILCGLVFVIQADAEVLDETAVLAINDLGPLGESFTRASVTTDGTRVYGHTIREVVAIGVE